MSSARRLQQILQTRFDQARFRNPSLSLRAFCKHYGLKSGVVSLILLGKRKAGKKTLEEISQALSFDPHERAEVFSDLHAKPLNQTSLQYLQISAEQYRLISEWYYLAILYLSQVKDFIPQSQWISNRLGIPQKTVEAAIERLFKFGYLTFSSEGGWVLSKPHLRTTDDVQNSALKRSHDEGLDLARSSLHNDSVDRRDFTWLVLPVASSKMSRAKELIREFQDRFLAEMETDKENKDEVYRLAVQFFPHTRSDDKKLGA